MNLRPPPFTETATTAEPLAADAIVASLVAVILGCATLFAINVGDWSVYAVIHLVVVAVGVLWAKASGSPPRRQAALLALSIVFLGVLGAVAAAMCMGFEAWFRPQARGFMEWYNDLFPEEDVEAAELLLNRLRSGGDPASGAADLTSFTDAIAYGSIEQKQAVVALIARRFTPAFAPALRRALEDPVPAVRVQAAAAAAAIEARFTKRAMALEKAANARDASVASLKDLGRLHADLAQCGLLEQARADTARDKALQAYERVLSIAPDDVTALTACGELLLAKGDAAAAAAHLARALQLSQSSAGIASLLVESLLRQGRFDELRRFARAGVSRFSGGDWEVERLGHALALWSQGAPACVK